jgi:hypothetical protein
LKFRYICDAMELGRMRRAWCWPPKVVLLSSARENDSASCWGRAARAGAAVRSHRRALLVHHQKLTEKDTLNERT